MKKMSSSSSSLSSSSSSLVVLIVVVVYVAKQKKNEIFQKLRLSKTKVINKLKESWRGPFVINKARFYHSLSL